VRLTITFSAHFVTSATWLDRAVARYPNQRAPDGLAQADAICIDLKIRLGDGRPDEGGKAKGCKK